MIAVKVGEDTFSVPYHRGERVKSFLRRVVGTTGIGLIYGYLLINDSRFNRLDEEPKFNLEVEQLGITSLTYRGGSGGGPRACHWKDYIHSSSIEPGSRNIGWKPTMTIFFKPFRPWTPKIDCSCLNSSPGYLSFQNSWPDYWESGIDRGYKFVDMPRRTIMLIELSVSVADLVKIRYDVYGCNQSYYGGEYDSWQRYTRKKPIEASVVIHNDAVSITPVSHLVPNQWHAVILLNTPISGFRGIPAIYDDHLIPFLPNDVSRCRKACLAFILGMGKRRSYLRMHAIIVCRYYVWPSRFDDIWI